MELLVVALLVVLITALWKKVWVELIWRPYAITKAFRMQGVTGPAYKFRRGSIDEAKRIEAATKNIILNKSSHDITARIHGSLHQWTKQYGSMFLFWEKARPRICITDPEMIKELLTDKSGSFIKGNAGTEFFTLLGKGLFLMDGEEWAHNRRALSPAFTKDRVKDMAMKIVDCANIILERWHNQIIQANNQAKEIEVYKEFVELSSDVIAHAIFGTSYQEEMELFITQSNLFNHLMRNALNFKVFGVRNLPTRKNLHKWDLQKKVTKRIIDIIQSKLHSRDGEYGIDLIRILIESSQKEGNQILSMDNIKNHCRTFLSVGPDSPSVCLSWAIFLLSTSQEWQHKLRDEVIRECGTEVPSADALSKLKLVTMFLLETLRLYGPVVLFGRNTSKDTIIGNLKIPKGISWLIPVHIVHRLEEFWGPDANQFNPTRFENGVAGAVKHPNAFLAFSVGPRKCIAQNFVMFQAKMVIAMILQKFTFSLSSNYKHAPQKFITLRPKYGIPIIFKPLHV